MAAGDRLLLYTDGVLEAVNRTGDFFGDRRFREVITRHASQPSAALTQTIMDELAGWCGGTTRFDDDATLIVVEV